MTDFVLTQPEIHNPLTTPNTRASDPVLAKVAHDEPIFVLRAADKDAPATVLKWAEYAEQAGVPLHRVVRAQAIAHQMIAWQIAHGAKHVD